MSSATSPLEVVVVSNDVSLLHEISWVLEAVGYDVQTACDSTPDALWRRYALPDFLIVDGRSLPEPTADPFAHETEKQFYRIVLYDPDKPFDFAAWYAAGAHDVLRTPVSRGELLARVRTGARFLEFDRRLHERSARCPLTGMYTRRGLVRKLQNLSASDESGSTTYTLLVTSIAWYTGIRRKHGESVGRSLAAAAARTVRRAVGDNAVAAYLGNGRFAVLLSQALASAKTVAESLTRDFANRESHHASIPRPTLISAVVPWSGASGAAQFLDDALETLELAEHSGGERVLVPSEFDRELAAWREEMSTGNPFANVVAQDIMESFPAILEHGLDERDLIRSLHAAGVPVLPYVNRDGRLVGVASDQNAASDAHFDTTKRLPGNLLAMPETIPHDATFPEIYEAFSSRGCATLVVMAQERPLGYITCDGFLSMIDPLHTQSFANSNKSPDELAYLIVPSTFGESAAEAGQPV
jgi:GGDEF domain-containing protein